MGHEALQGKEPIPTLKKHERARATSGAPAKRTPPPPKATTGGAQTNALTRCAKRHNRPTNNPAMAHRA